MINMVWYKLKNNIKYYYKKDITSIVNYFYDCNINPCNYIIIIDALS